MSIFGAYYKILGDNTWHKVKKITTDDCKNSWYLAGNEAAELKKDEGGNEYLYMTSGGQENSRGIQDFYQGQINFREVGEGKKRFMSIRDF